MQCDEPYIYEQAAEIRSRDPTITGMSIRAVHIEELRARLNEARVALGQSAIALPIQA